MGKPLDQFAGAIHSQRLVSCGPWSPPLEAPLPPLLSHALGPRASSAQSNDRTTDAQATAPTNTSQGQARLFLVLFATMKLDKKMFKKHINVHKHQHHCIVPGNVL